MCTSVEIEKFLNMATGCSSENCSVFSYKDVYVYHMYTALQIYTQNTMTQLTYCFVINDNQ